MGLDVGLGVTGEAEVERLAAGLAHEGGQAVAIRVANLAHHQRSGCLDQLIAGGEDADAWAAVGTDRLAADAGQHADVAGIEKRALGEDELADLHVLAGRAHGIAERGSVEHADLRGGGAGRVRVLDRHDAVGAVGHGRTGHDPDRLPRTDPRRWRGTSGQRGHDREITGHAHDVGGPHGEAVHRRIGERWDLLGRDHVLGQHPAERVVQRNIGGRETRASCDHPVLRLIKAQQCHAAEGSGRSVRDLPGRYQSLTSALR